MLRINGKKINTAFGRLRERRQSVGLTSAAETPEQEAARIQKEIQAASASGDISTIIKLVTNTSKMTTADFIQKTCGSLLFVYYTYVNKYHVRPVDMDDLIDGLLYLDAKSYIIKESQSKG